MLLATSAYEQRERAAYWRSGLITAAIVNSNRGKSQRPAKPEDFMPRRKSRPQSAERMAELLKAATVAMGGEVMTGGD